MKHIAVDLGAGSGRIVVGRSKDDADLDVLQRFVTPSVVLPSGIYWDIPAIFNNIKQGLARAINKYGDEIASISIDSWGVDYALLDSSSEMITLPYHYRDQRSDGSMEKVFAIISDRELYNRTGVQLMQLNTLFQLHAFREGHSELLDCASCYLSIPDLLTYWLCGERVNERTHASTTQLFSPHNENWDRDLMDAVGIPQQIFGEIVPSGTVLAPLLPQVRDEVSAPASLRVIAGAGHDTQAAAFTVPDREDSAFLSCGTWSVMGIEGKKAFISDKSFAASASNEASARGGFNLLKNILGLWILQECKAEWDEEDSPLRYSDLIEHARAAPAVKHCININDDSFLKSRHQAGSMQKRINRQLEKEGLPPSSSRGQTVRLILESLAELYNSTLSEIESISGRSIGRIHIIGGGAQNDLLCTLTKERSNREVIIGHPEATAYGNILIQEDACSKIS